MSHLITGLFKDSKLAGEAVAELKEKGYTDEMSVAARNEDTHSTKTTSIKSSGAEGAAVGGMVGALGGLSAMLFGLSSFVIPGAGILVAGPLSAALASAAGGAAVGGIVGALIDKGIPDNTAQLYESRVKAGDVLVAVSASHDKEIEVQQILKKYGASTMEKIHGNIS